MKKEIKLESINFSKEFKQIEITVPDAKEKKSKSVELSSEPPKKEVVNMSLDMGALITLQKRDHKRDEPAT